MADYVYTCIISVLFEKGLQLGIDHYKVIAVFWNLNWDNFVTLLIIILSITVQLAS